MNELGDAEKRDRKVGEQPRREQPPAVPTLQKFASVHANVHNHFNQERHLVDRQDLQGTTLGRIGRVAISHGLSPRIQSFS